MPLCGPPRLTWSKGKDEPVVSVLDSVSISVAELALKGQAVLTLLLVLGKYHTNTFS